MTVAAIYARVSTAEQHTVNQLPELHRHAELNNWPAVEYLEEASGKEGGVRPVLARLLEDVKAGRIQVVLCWKMDRFGRSVKDLIRNIETLNASNCRFICTSQSIDTDHRNPMGKLTAYLMMMLAEFERDCIVERVKLGTERYLRDVAAGRIGVSVHTRSGKDRMRGRPRLIWNRGRALEMKQQGMTVRAIALELGVPRNTVQTALKPQPKKPTATAAA